MDSLSELERLVRPPAQPLGSPVDWAAAQRDLAMQLPEDYRRLVDTYGLGCFDGFLWLLHPNASSRYLNLGRQITVRLEALKEGQSPGEPFGPDDVVPWAFTDNGDVCYWKVMGMADPNKWTVVVNESRGPEWDEFSGTTTEWLAAVLSGRYRVRVFPDQDFPSQSPRFRSSAAAIPAAD